MHLTCAMHAIRPLDPHALGEPIHIIKTLLANFDGRLLTAGGDVGANREIVLGGGGGEGVVDLRMGVEVG